MHMYTSKYWFHKIANSFTFYAMLCVSVNVWHLPALKQKLGTLGADEVSGEMLWQAVNTIKIVEGPWTCMVWQLLGTQSTPQLILLLVLLSVFFGVGFPLFSMLRKAIFRPFANYLVPNTRCKYSNEEKQAPSRVLHCLHRSKSEIIISWALVVAASSPNVKDFAVDLMCSSFSHSECNNSCGPAGFITEFSNL